MSGGAGVGQDLKGGQVLLTTVFPVLSVKDQVRERERERKKWIITKVQ